MFIHWVFVFVAVWFVEGGLGCIQMISSIALEGGLLRILDLHVGLRRDD